MSGDKIQVDTTDADFAEKTVEVVTSHWHEGAAEGFHMTVSEDGVTFSFYTDGALMSSKTFDSWEYFYDFITAGETE